MRARVEELFHRVADLPEEDRERYFAERNIEDRIRKEVEALLAFDSASSISVDQDLGEVAATILAGLEKNDTRCGPYQLGALLGRGGMGTVYLAERVDGEVTQQVAIKVIGFAANSPLRDRFLAERQILATLSHPNIARLLDAGHREDGQPYLVMEHVAGKALDVYTSGLGIRDKVVLFLKVCGAVIYLHRNLVVHRDLKPSNILVTEDGEPKLLDFGIAKMLNLTSDSTVTSSRMLTPKYASPEQLIGGPVTTATDLYSLGALLYNLLTGVPPHQFNGVTMEAVVATILNGKIVPPSRSKPELKGDLEVILLKALRKEPQERYATVEPFAEDLENYLEGRPIRARQGDKWYRTRKVLRRHWAPAVLTALVIASLSIGLFAADGQRKIAERRFEQLRRLSNRLIDLDGSMRGLPGSVEARQRLVAASLEYLEGLSREAEGNVDLAEEIAEGYWRMGRIQGGNAEFNLGDPIKAETSLSKADEFIHIVLAARPHDRNAQIRSAYISTDRMILAETDQRRANALAHARKAIERLSPLVGNHAESSAAHGERARIASLYCNIALAHVNMHLYADGAGLARRAAEISESLPAASDIHVMSLSVLANALRYQGDLDSALATIRKARQLSDVATYAHEAARFFNRYGVLLREGLILGEANAINLGRPEEAIDVLGQAMRLSEDAARKDARDSASRGRVGTTARELGTVLRERDPRRALTVYDSGIRRQREAGTGKKARRDLAALLAGSSYPLRRLGRPEEARKRIADALHILKETDDYPSNRVRLGSQAYATASALADHEAETGDPRRAIGIYTQLLDAVMATKPEPLEDLRDTPKLSHIYETLGGLHRRTGNLAKATAMSSRRLELWRHWQQQLPNNPFVQRQFSDAMKQPR